MLEKAVLLLFSVASVPLWFSRRLVARTSRPSRQRERHYPVPTPPHASTAGADDHVLLSIQPVRHRGGFAARGEIAAPQLAARLDIERANRSIERPRHEHETARGRDRTAEGGGAPVCGNGCTGGGQSANGAERHLPHTLARRKAHGDERSERRRRAGKP